MKIKRILLSVIGLLICVILIYIWFKYNEGGPVSYPINTGSFFTIGSATIDPKTLLDDVKSGKEPLLKNVQSGLPEIIAIDTTFGWSQNDYLEIAEALYREIWMDDPNNWHLYRISFYTNCKNPSNKFESADLYYYQEVKEDGKRMYSVRNILIEPNYGYIVWGGDTFYPRPIWGWEEIEIEKIKSVPAEKALEMANQRGGTEFRSKENSDCRISIDMYPWGYDRSDWNVSYSGNIDLTTFEIWIPLK